MSFYTLEAILLPLIGVVLPRSQLSADLGIVRKPTRGLVVSEPERLSDHKLARLCNELIYRNTLILRLEYEYVLLSFVHADERVAVQTGHCDDGSTLLQHYQRASPADKYQVQGCLHANLRGAIFFRTVLPQIPAGHDVFCCPRDQVHLSGIA